MTGCLFTTKKVAQKNIRLMKRTSSNFKLHLLVFLITITISVILPKLNLYAQSTEDNATSIENLTDLSAPDKDEEFNPDSYPFSAPDKDEESNPDSYSGLDRIKNCTREGKIEQDFAMLVSYAGDKTSLAKDFSREPDKCNIALIASAFVVWKALIVSINKFCKVNHSVGVFKPIGDLVIIVKGLMKIKDTPECRNAFIALPTTIAILVSALAATFGLAKEAFENISICGDGWLTPNPQKYDFSGENKVNTEGAVVIGGNTDYTGSEKSIQSKELIEARYLNSSNPTELDVRQFLNGGIEFEAKTPTKTCYDPTVSADEKSPQKYYLRGFPNGKFNCNKYLYTNYSLDPLNNAPFTPERIAQFKTAFECCKDISENHICVKNNDDYRFCRKDSECHLGVFAKVNIKENNDGKIICAQVENYCPYQFSVRGGSYRCRPFKDGAMFGTEWKDFSSHSLDDVEKFKTDKKCSDYSEIRNNDCSFNDKVGKCKNYCQYMRHCTITSKVTENYNNSLSSPYFSKACYDFRGDSLNGSSLFAGTLGVASPLLPTNFTTPIVQCLKESIENIFLNRYGKSFCLSAEEKPDKNGTCISGYQIEKGFLAKQGMPVNSTSFFAKSQNLLLNSIKLFLMFYVMIIGARIAIGAFDLNKKEILLLIFKISIVVYFALGTGWKDNFFQLVYRVSETASQIIFKISVSKDESERDGCQFGLLNIAKTKIFVSSLKNQYPDGKGYLAIWDTIDCKIARYLGFGPSLSIPNIAKIIFTGYISSLNPILAMFNKLSIWFSVLLLIVAILLISIAIRAVHIFITSSIIIVLLIFVSPLTITLSLFEKTKKIFNDWLSQLIGVSLQPIILFIYLALFITILDKAMTGGATFVDKSNGAIKTIECRPYCYDDKGTKNYDKSKCGENKDVVIPIENSVACLVDEINSKFDSWSIGSVIGLSFAVLKNPDGASARAIIINLAKVMLILYVLYSFMDSIPGIASRIFGGVEMKGGEAIKPISVITTIAGASLGGQQIGQRSIKKLLGFGSKDGGT
jgi:type IV secretory pathway VirB6-like protein